MTLPSGAYGAILNGYMGFLSQQDQLTVWENYLTKNGLTGNPPETVQGLTSFNQFVQGTVGSLEVNQGVYSPEQVIKLRVVFETFAMALDMLNQIQKTEQVLSNALLSNTNQQDAYTNMLSALNLYVQNPNQGITVNSTNFGATSYGYQNISLNQIFQYGVNAIQGDGQTAVVPLYTLPEDPSNPNSPLDTYAIEFVGLGNAVTANILKNGALILSSNPGNAGPYVYQTQYQATQSLATTNPQSNESLIDPTATQLLNQLLAQSLPAGTIGSEYPSLSAILPGVFAASATNPVTNLSNYYIGGGQVITEKALEANSYFATTDASYTQFVQLPGNVAATISTNSNQQMQIQPYIVDNSATSGTGATIPGLAALFNDPVFNTQFSAMVYNTAVDSAGRSITYGGFTIYDGVIFPNDVSPNVDGLSVYADNTNPPTLLLTTHDDPQLHDFDVPNYGQYVWNYLMASQSLGSYTSVPLSSPVTASLPVSGNYSFIPGLAAAYTDSTPQGNGNTFATNFDSAVASVSPQVNSNPNASASVSATEDGNNFVFLLSQYGSAVRVQVSENGNQLYNGNLANAIIAYPPAGYPGPQPVWDGIGADFPAYELALSAWVSQYATWTTTYGQSLWNTLLGSPQTQQLFIDSLSEGQDARNLWGNLLSLSVPAIPAQTILTGGEGVTVNGVTAQATAIPWRATGDFNSATDTTYTADITYAQQQRAEYNAQLQVYIDNARSQRQAIINNASPLQSDLTQSQQEVTQMSNLLQSIIDSLKGIISSITR